MRIVLHIEPLIHTIIHGTVHNHKFCVRGHLQCMTVKSHS